MSTEPSLAAQVSHFIGEPDPDTMRALHGISFICLGADSFVTRKVRPILDYLVQRGVHLLAYRVLHYIPETGAEELYRYNLNDSGDHPWWLHRRKFALGPIMGVIVGGRGDDGATFQERVRRLKGACNPILNAPGCVRFDFRAQNPLLNLIHCSDDILSALREARIFFEPGEILDAVRAGDAVVREGRADLAIAPEAVEARISVDYPARADLRFHAVMYAVKRRVVARLLDDGGRWLSTGELAGLSRLEGLYRSAEADLEREMPVAESLRIGHRCLLRERELLSEVFPAWRLPPVEGSPFPPDWRSFQEARTRNALGHLLGSLGLLANQPEFSEIDVPLLCSILRENNVPVGESEEYVIMTNLFYFGRMGPALREGC